MTLAGADHADHGATFRTRGDREVVAHYGRPDRAGHAVRNGVGTIEMGYGIVVVEGEDRTDFVDNAVSNPIPATDGRGTYALLLDPQGRIETDMYAYEAGERLLVFTPPSRAAPLAEDWAAKTFVQDVTVREATEEFGVFGVHGANATEKVASVLDGASPNAEPLTFVRGSMHDAGVTVVTTDAPTGQEGYEVVCAAEDAPAVFDTLVTRGLNAAPFGYETWESLTAEAGTPLFPTELDGRVPNVLGLRNAVDFEKGCFVGQEVVSKVENRGRPSSRLVGLRPERTPTAGAAVFAGDESVGEVTRAADGVVVDGPLALALVDFDAPGEGLTVRVDGAEVPADRVPLPFVDGDPESARLPNYSADD
ncbi:MAG: aminomethyltransferase family protein [Halolamina sp.]